MARGTLRIYLGAAPGVGKTFAMLGEGHRRAERGTDVVVGYVETHGRPKTAEQVAGLEVVPRRTVEYRGTTFEEMDVDAILARRPEVALVDELAHTNVPGSQHEKRWEDVEALLDAGITVISTLNVQHLESVNDVVEQITGIKQQETIPDAVVRRADQIELVDMAPEAIRRRMAHGNIYPGGAHRRLARQLLPDGEPRRAARARAPLGRGSRRRRAAGLPRAARHRPALGDARAGRRRADGLGGRRAPRAPRRADGDAGEGRLLCRSRAPPGRPRRRGGRPAGPAARARRGARRNVPRGRRRGHRRGARRAAHTLNATQIVLGATRRSRFAELTRGSVINRVIRDSGVGLDVHVISRADDGAAATTSRTRRPGALPGDALASASCSRPSRCRS